MKQAFLVAKNISFIVGNRTETYPSVLLHYVCVKIAATFDTEYATVILVQGAATTCYVALHPQVKGVTGKYFSNSNFATPGSQTSDADLASKLWDLSMDMISSCL